MSTSVAKQQIMKARKPKVTNVETLEYHTAADAVYGLIKKYGGLGSADLVTALVHDKSDVKEKAVSNALYNLKREGYLRAEIGKGRDNPTVYYVNEDMDYKLRGKRITKKVAPNDKKAIKSIRRMTRIKPTLSVVQSAEQVELPLEKSDATPSVAVQTTPEPIQHQDANLTLSKKITGKPGKFEFIQGLAAIDPSSPHFGKTAHELAKQTGQEVKEGEPLAVVFFQFGNGQTPILSLGDTFRLYKELHAAFGKK